MQEKKRQQAKDDDSDAADSIYAACSLLREADDGTATPSLPFVRWLCSGENAMRKLWAELLRNDSLLDIAARANVYFALLELLKLFATHASYTVLLLLPGYEQSPPLIEHLKKLNLQAEVFSRGAAQVGEDAVANEALGICLDLRAAFALLESAVAKWQSCMPSSDGTSRLSRWLQVLLPAERVGSSSTIGATGASASTSTSAFTGATSYCASMRELQFRMVEGLSDGHFYRNGKPAHASGLYAHSSKGRNHSADSSLSKINRGGQLRIHQELSSISTSLPLSAQSSIFVVVDESRHGCRCAPHPFCCCCSLSHADHRPYSVGASGYSGYSALLMQYGRSDLLRALITGPAGTPYENGCFLFDILLPPDYPDSPP